MKKISIVSIVLLLSSIFSMFLVNTSIAHANMNSEKVTNSEKLLSNLPQALETDQSKWTGLVSDEMIQTELENAKSKFGKVGIDKTSATVSIVQENNYLIKFNMNGAVEKNSFLYFVYNDKMDCIETGSVFAHSVNSNLTGYVYSNNHLNIEITGKTDKNIYTIKHFDKNQEIIEDQTETINLNSRSFVGCVTDCVNKLLGGWQATIALAACAAACGVSAGIGCFACAGILAGYGAGWCWEKC